MKFLIVAILSLSFYSYTAGADHRNIVLQDQLNLPSEVDGPLNLSGIFSFQDFILPKKVKGDLFLSGLYKAEFLFFPDEVLGSIYAETIKDKVNVDRDIKVKAEDNFVIEINPANKVNQYKYGRPDVIMRKLA